MASSDSFKYTPLFGLKLDGELQKQLKYYVYHMEAINFITRHWTKKTDSQNISSLIKLLKPILRNDAKAYQLLKSCLKELAEYDVSFYCYLQHFPGEAPYSPPPTPMDTLPSAGQGDSTNSQTTISFTPPTRIDHSNIAQQRLDADGDNFLLTIADNIASTKLEDFCVRGLGMKFTEYENLTIDFPNHSGRARGVLKNWRQKAPTGSIPEHSTKFPPFTRQYLKQALQECKHNDAILALNL